MHFAVLLIAYVGNAKDKQFINPVMKCPYKLENSLWKQNPEAEMNICSRYEYMTKYCLKKYGCDNQNQNINNNVKKCFEYYKDIHFASQPNYSKENAWIYKVSSKPKPTTTSPKRTATTKNTKSATTTKRPDSTTTIPTSPTSFDQKQDSCQSKRLSKWRHVSPCIWYKV